MGKGSDRRARDDKYCTAEQFGDRWDQAFKIEEKKEESPKKEGECPGNG